MSMTTNNQGQKAKNGGAPVDDQSKRKIWDDLKKLDARREKLRADLVEIDLALSAKVCEIKETQGDGPFQVAGLGFVQIRSRRTKNEAGETISTTHYLAKTARDVEVIE